MEEKEKKSNQSGISNRILGQVDKIFPGFHGFFKKAEKSKTFGSRIAEIRKEIDRRFGHLEK